MNTQQTDHLSVIYQQSRGDLQSYLTRLVVRPDVAEELVQQAALKAVETKGLPVDDDGARAWLFKVGTNLAIDHLRRHSTWRENVLIEAREQAVQDEAYIAESKLLRGSAEMGAIAHEHLAVCLSCTLRNLQPEQAAALLLVEVYGFGVEEAAQILDATFSLTKNWIQSARSRLREKYNTTCALITKQGTCYQCVELSHFFNGREEDPLAGTSRDIDARLEILRKHRTLGPWHRIMMRIVDDLLTL